MIGPKSYIECTDILWNWENKNFVRQTKKYAKYFTCVLKVVLK